MIVRPWEKGDFQKIEIQDAQAYTYDLIDMDVDLTDLSQQGLVQTCVHNGEIMLIEGFIPVYENRAEVCTLISKYAGRCFTSIHKEALNFLNNAPFQRVEATVDVGFKQGHRWVKMLGFELEGYLKYYRPDGADMILYARYK